MADQKEKQSQPAVSGKADVAIVLGGNPGGGKTFLLNSVAGREVFLHMISPGAVTEKEECIEMEAAPFFTDDEKSKPRKIALWNLQGTVELQGANAKRNCNALDRAFQSAPEQVLAFVIKPQNGRLEAEDVGLFMELVRVYQVRPESTCLLINGSPYEDKKDKNGEGEWLSQFVSWFLAVTGIPSLSYALMGQVPDKELDHKDVFTSSIARANKALFLQLLQHMKPKSHKRQGDMVLTAHLFSTLRKKIEQVEKETAQNKDKFQLTYADVDNKMAFLRKESQEIVERLTVQLASLQQQMDNVRQDEQQAARDHEHNMGEYARVLRELEQQQQQLAVLYQQEREEMERYLAEVVRDSQERIQQAREQEAATKESKKFKNQLKAVGKQIKRRPGPVLLGICTMIAAPYAAAPLVPLIGKTAAVMVVHAAMSGVVAIANKEKKVVQSMVVGGMGGGLSVVGSNLSLVGNGALQAAGAGASSVVMGHTKLKDIASAALGSATGSLVGSAFVTNPSRPSLIGQTVKTTATSVSSAVASTLVSCPNGNLTAVVAHSLVHGAISGTAQGAVLVAESKKQQHPPPQENQHTTQGDQKQTKSAPTQTEKKEEKKGRKTVVAPKAPKEPSSPPEEQQTAKVASTPSPSNQAVPPPPPMSTECVLLQQNLKNVCKQAFESALASSDELVSPFSHIVRGVMCDKARKTFEEKCPLRGPPPPVVSDHPCAVQAHAMAAACRPDSVGNSIPAARQECVKLTDELLQCEKAHGSS